MQGPRDDVDDAIAALNSPPQRGRKDSADSINFRDTGFDPSGAPNHRKNDSGSFIQPIPVNDFGNQGGDVNISHREAGNFLDDEEKEAEEQRRLEEEKKKN